MANLKAKEYRKFEDIKYVRKDGSEYWSARELAAVLDYSQWRNFQKVIDRAMIACENSGHEVEYDFAEVSKIVEAGAASKSIKDYELTRYAMIIIRCISAWSSVVYKSYGCVYDRFWFCISRDR